MLRIGLIGLEITTELPKSPALFDIVSQSRLGGLCLTGLPVALFSAIWLLLGCREPYVIVPIVPHAALSPNWSEFRPEHPLRWSEPGEELSFHIDTPHQIGDHLEIVKPKGEGFVPDVELVSTDGKTFVMDTHGFLGGDIFFTFISKPPTLTSIAAVRVRSRIPINVSDMIWRGYDPEEVKR